MHRKDRGLIKELLKQTTPYDWLLLFFLIIVSLSGLISMKKFLPSGSLVTIEVEGREVYKLSLFQDRTVEIKGPIGTTVVEIKGQRVRIVESPCPNKICIKQGWISRGAIVCLPNRVVVTVGSGETTGGIDAITR